MPKKESGAFTLAPLHDRVIVKPIQKEEKTSPSGIIIPEMGDKERPMRGEVVAVGPGKYDEDTLIPMSVKVGDEVIFSKYGYDEVKVEGQEYLILSESSILAVIK
jgi:chaperonin GroES